MTYPNDPGFVKDSDTSFAASRSFGADSLRELVRAHIASQGRNGATCDEVEVALDMRHQTCSARCRELVLKGGIIKTVSVRPTRSGCKAHVYVTGDTAHV